MVNKTKKRRHIIGGYIWNAAMTRAQAANERARVALTELHEHLTSTSEMINVLLLSQLLMEACLAVGESTAALNELKHIVDAQLQERIRK